MWDVRYTPPHYGKLEISVPCSHPSLEWITFHLPDCQQQCFLWRPWSVLLRHHYGSGEPWYEPDLPWRVDVVLVSPLGQNTFTVKDMFIDVNMSENGRRYKVVDIDELLEATSRGEVDHSECMEALQILQRWLDMLHGFRTTRDFPPRDLPAADE